jgi:hypothetical protein
MKNLHEKGVAIRSAPSFALDAARCAAKRKQGNRWAGYGAPKTCNQDAHAVRVAEGHMTRSASASSWAVLRSRRPQTRLARISHQLFGTAFEGAESGDCGLTLSR